MIPGFTARALAFVLLAHGVFVPQLAAAVQRDAGSPPPAVVRRQQLAARQVALGKQALVVTRNPHRAYFAFQTAVRLDPKNPEANLYLAITRLLSWPMRHRRLFAEAGCVGLTLSQVTSSDLNPLQFVTRLPEIVRIPPGFSGGAKLQAFLATEGSSELRNSLENLDRVTRPFSSSLPIRNPLTGASAIEIDDGDVSLMRAAVYLALAHIAFSQVYNVDINLRDLTEISGGNFDLRQDLLDPYPKFLRLQNTGSAQATKDALIKAIDHYLTADRLIRREGDDQTDDLFAFSNLPEDLRKAGLFRRALVDLKKSLKGLSDPAWTLTCDQLLDLGTVLLCRKPMWRRP